MDPTNPLEVTPNDATQQETLEKSNVQKRIDELTAEKMAERQRAAQYESQVAQLTSTVAELLKSQSAPKAQQEAAIPEGIDPVMAQFFKSQIDRVASESKADAHRMYWQMQNQLDQARVAEKYGQLPKEVIADAANRLTGLKQRFGEQAVTMDDAVALAHFDWFKKQGGQAAAQQYNAMGRPLSMQSAPAAQTQSTNLMSPTSLPNWDSFDNVTQNKLIDEWEKKGGRLIG